MGKVTIRNTVDLKIYSIVINFFCFCFCFFNYNIIDTDIVY